MPGLTSCDLRSSSLTTVGYCLTPPFIQGRVESASCETDVTVPSNTMLGKRFDADLGLLADLDLLDQRFVDVELHLHLGHVGKSEDSLKRVDRAPSRIWRLESYQWSLA